MWKAILENEGYDVELTLVEMGPQMASLAEGDLDIAPEIWLPVQDKSYYEEYKDSVDFAEDPWYENGKVGLAVPEYMDDINSIEDLNENKDKFNGEITGFEPGAGTMITTEEMIDAYDLDYELG
ncbi:glycine betaine ABC transporter substrate-binding protein [Lentibacillus sp. CBA3610]|uniref:glycine betaine ABC transporter substrate-binding protein n=1 Tax=Lentibacillus sp. CBA3610 TaxID=2518176 RepID=UPI0020D2178A|nr:glycine betaine ABC transporter substrate-binding protein [Lentibacillus sp. CBA3610]